METLITLLLKYLPNAAEAIRLLQYVPAAADTVKELIAFVNRTIEYLKQDAPLTKEQEAELDKFIEEDWKTKPYWQPPGPAPVPAPEPAPDPPGT